MPVGSTRRFSASYCSGWLRPLGALAIHQHHKFRDQAAPQPALRTLADEYFDQVYFHYAPSNATLQGLHQYDAQLEDYSQAGVDREIAEQERFERIFAAVPADQLDLTSQGDLELLLGNIRSRLLSLKTIRLWEKDPDQYSSGISNSAFVLMERSFASPDDRLRSLVAREKLMPAALDAARTNLKNPPRIYTEIALEQLPDIISFFQVDVPEAFKQAQNEQLKSEFSQSNSAVIAALKSYQGWLKKDVLPRSHGDFRFGAETYSKKLLYDEMVDTPLPRLLEIGYADLHKNQAEFKRIAREIDPNRQPREVLEELDRDHPAPRSSAAEFSRHVPGFDPVHPGKAYCRHSFSGAPHAGKHAAVHARHHDRIHGHAGSL